MDLDRELLSQAVKDTKHARSQIQGFHYPKRRRYCVRNLLLDPGSQEVWSEVTDDHKSAECTMEQEIVVRRAQLVKDRYRELEQKT